MSESLRLHGKRGQAAQVSQHRRCHVSEPSGTCQPIVLSDGQRPSDINRSRTTARLSSVNAHDHEEKWLSLFNATTTWNGFLLSNK